MRWSTYGVKQAPTNQTSRGAIINAINKESKVALVLSSEEEVSLLTTALGKAGLRRITTFRTSDEAYEVASRQKFDFFVVGMKLSDAPGVTLLQRLKEIGNYGPEPFLFLGEKMDDSTLSICLEHDVDYILLAPINEARLVGKINEILETENNVSPELQTYRDAKSAYAAGIHEMAEDYALSLKDTSKYELKVNILLGDIKLEQNKMHDAKQSYEHALALDSKSVHAKHRIAKWHMKQGQHQVAKEMMEALIESNPYHIKVIENAGLSNLELGNLDAAKNQLARLSKIDKTNKTGHTMQAKINIAEGNISGCAATLKKTHSEKEIISLLNTAGVKMAKQKDFASAIKIYKDCLRVCKSKDFMSKIHYNLALAYEGTEQIPRAINALQFALQCDPEFSKAQQFLGRIQLSKAS